MRIVKDYELGDGYRDAVLQPNELLPWRARVLLATQVAAADQVDAFELAVSYDEMQGLQALCSDKDELQDCLAAAAAMEDGLVECSIEVGCDRFDLSFNPEGSISVFYTDGALPVAVGLLEEAERQFVRQTGETD